MPYCAVCGKPARAFRTRRLEVKEYCSWRCRFAYRRWFYYIAAMVGFIVMLVIVLVAYAANWPDKENLSLLYYPLGTYTLLFSIFSIVGFVLYRKIEK